MSNENSSRVIGVIIVCLGVFLTGLNGFCAYRTGQFYAIAAFLGPIAMTYGLAVILRPPSKMPQTEFEALHKVFASIGFFLGVAYFLILRFVDVRQLLNG
jgi:hypothetical protein